MMKTTIITTQGTEYGLYSGMFSCIAYGEAINIQMTDKTDREWNQSSLICKRKTEVKDRHFYEVLTNILFSKKDTI